MARAKRHYIPGQVWHLTHRCHKREFLLRFAKDKSRWVQWLFEAKRRYGLTILNYTVTSNHIHLLVVDDSLGSVDNVRDSRWTQSIATGGEAFVKRVKGKLCSNASGRKLNETIDGYELREEVSSYIAFSDPEKSNIDLLNTYEWNTLISISGN